MPGSGQRPAGAGVPKTSLSKYLKGTGSFRGTLLGRNNQPIRNDGLWGLRFGNGVTGSTRTLLFTAGIDAEDDGLFGELRAGH
jgi:hypothetical protein